MWSIVLPRLPRQAYESADSTEWRTSTPAMPQRGAEKCPSPFAAPFKGSLPHRVRCLVVVTSFMSARLGTPTSSRLSLSGRASSRRGRSTLSQRTVREEGDLPLLAFRGEDLVGSRPTPPSAFPLRLSSPAWCRTATTSEKASAVVWRSQINTQTPRKLGVCVWPGCAVISRLLGSLPSAFRSRFNFPQDAPQDVTPRRKCANIGGVLNLY